LGAGELESDDIGLGGVGVEDLNGL
jgi:hypothetical protein